MLILYYGRRLNYIECQLGDTVNLLMKPWILILKGHNKDALPYTKAEETNNKIRNNHLKTYVEEEIHQQSKKIVNIFMMNGRKMNPGHLRSCGIMSNVGLYLQKISR